LNKPKKLSFRYINRLAIPAIISGIAEPLLSITDTAIVGNIQQDPVEALAAVGIAGSFLSALVWILAQTRSAISAIIAQNLGANRLKDIDALPAQIIAINIGLSVLLYFTTIFFVEEIFTLYNAQGLILEYSVSYFKIRALGLPLTRFVFTVFGIFRGLQNTFWPMIISIVGAVLNVGLDLMLIFGVEGIVEPMHIEGAAWASVISQFVMAVMALILSVKKTPFSLKFRFPFHPEIKRILNLSVNLFIRALALNVALYMANAYAAGYGANYIAAQTIAFQIWLFFAFFIDGYASVGNIVSGKFVGEKNYASVWELSKDLIRFTTIITIIIGGISFIFYKDIGLLFTKETEVLDLFYQIFWLVIIIQPVNAVAFIFDGIFKGMAEAVTLRNTLIIATFLGFVPVLLLGDYFHLKLYAVWMAFSVWMVLRGGILVVIFRKRFMHM
jgi:putative MATE family efflux protein